MLPLVLPEAELECVVRQLSHPLTSSLSTPLSSSYVRTVCSQYVSISLYRLLGSTAAQGSVRCGAGKGRTDVDAWLEMVDDEDLGSEAGLESDGGAL